MTVRELIDALVALKADDAPVWVTGLYCSSDDSLIVEGVREENKYGIGPPKGAVVISSALCSG